MQPVECQITDLVLDGSIMIIILILMAVVKVCTAKMNLSDEVDLEDYVSRPDKISAADVSHDIDNDDDSDDEHHDGYDDVSLSW